MIVVIADDLSGAAEIANAALEAGLSADVQLRFDSASKADVVCVSTGTRSLPSVAAAEAVEQVARQVAAARPELIYKKCDSLLRGPVAAEATAVARTLGRARILLVPANPSRNRIILGGVYFVEGVRLAEATLASDPEHPRLSSRVPDLLGDASGIESPDVMSADDVSRLARRVDGSTLPVGGVDFFTALLAVRLRRTSRGIREPQLAAMPEGSSLFVCGSQAAWRAGRADEFARRRIPVFVLPDALLSEDVPDASLREWAAPVADTLFHRESALLALGAAHTIVGKSPGLLAETLARAVALVVALKPPARVFIEGGATATAVVKRLGHEQFCAEPSPGPGVGALRPMAASAQLFLIKPGSYPWPDAIWQLVRR